jgi:hypothetical protein
MPTRDDGRFRLLQRLRRCAADRVPQVLVRVLVVFVTIRAFVVVVFPSSAHQFLFSE